MDRDTKLSVSVIIPCFNVAEYVAQAVRSALDQQNFIEQIICIDDGSTDRTPDVLNNLVKENPERIKLITVNNGGACAARNLGLKASTSTYIQFLDADDLLLPGKLEHQTMMIRKSKEHPPDIIAAAYIRRGINDRERIIVPRDDPWIGLFVGRLGISSSNLWHRESLLAVGGWDEAFSSSQETDLMLRVMMAGGNVLIDHKPLTVCHDRPGSISSSRGFSYWNRWLDVRRRGFKYLKEKDMLTLARESAFWETAFRILVLRLYSYDPQGAIDLHAELASDGHFNPSRENAVDQFLATLYRLFGFRLTAFVGSLGYRLRNAARQKELF